MRTAGSDASAAAATACAGAGGRSVFWSLGRWSSFGQFIGWLFAWGRRAAIGPVELSLLAHRSCPHARKCILWAFYGHFMVDNTSSGRNEGGERNRRDKSIGERGTGRGCSGVRPIGYSTRCTTTAQ
eukprot:145812-Chlamydomonas_euryale.AAC.8